MVREDEVVSGLRLVHGTSCNKIKNDRCFSGEKKSTEPVLY